MGSAAARVWIAWAVAIGVLLRLRFLDVPLNVDEAGFGQVARLWSRGFALYGDVAWVDRPQGLVGAYRVAVTYGDERAIRLLAVVAGALLVVAVGAIAWTLVSPRVGAIAAWLVALLSPAPHLEGFTANGELLGGAVAACGIAVGVRWMAGGRAWLLPVAGVLAGAGPLMKQSAFDGAVMLVVVVLVASIRQRNLLALPGRLLVALLAIAAPWGAAALAAYTSVPGIAGWWFAIYGYRAASESVLSGDLGFRLERLLDSTPWMLVDGLPLLVLGVVGLVALRRERRLLLPLAWLGACWAGFLVGGLYHPHYWVQMLAPLALLAGAGAARLVDAWPVWRGRFAVAVLVALPLAAALPVYLASTPERMSLRSTNDPRVISAIPVGAAIALETEPDQRVQVLWANAAVYWHADRIPRTRYLWYRNIEFIPGAREDVVRAFTGEAPPRVVVGYQPVEALDVDGRIADALAEDYEQTVVDGVPFWSLAR